jgi:16S rRNA (cytosine967-C5)-methyltransferase
MTPAARVQAAIEILDLIIAAARNNGAPADRIIAEWFRTRRFAGSSDRRAVRELAYAAIRRCGEVPLTGRAAMLTCAKDDPALTALFDGSPHAPAPIGEGERYAKPGLAPAWLEKLLVASDISGAEAEALLGRAPLDVRINTLKASQETVDLPVAAETTVARNALRLPPGTNVEPWPAFNTGQIEIQDTASQLICEAVAARPGELVIDLCAGAGGKTLALAAAMENVGTLLAFDTDRGRLSRLMPRAERAGATMIETKLLNPMQEEKALSPWHGKADAVLVDSPCSGSGTWRRNPEGRWRLGKAELEKLTQLQARLLDLAAGLVKPGGRLLYATCSLLDAEGPDQVSAFLARHPEWRADPPILTAGSSRGSGLRLTPYHDGTDGFFVARLLPL